MVAQQIGRMLRGPHTYTKRVASRLRRRIERAFDRLVRRTPDPEELDAPLVKIPYRGWDD